MRKGFLKTVMVAAVLALVATPVWAGRGGGNSGGQGAGGGRDLSPSNKQAEPESVRGLERAS